MAGLTAAALALEAQLSIRDAAQTLRRSSVHAKTVVRRHMNQLREQLQEAEAQIRALREERARVRKLFESAKATAAEHQTEQSTGAAVAAKDALQQVEAKLEQAGDRQ